jgi:tetratricopeptide (TPR) repeat protein
MTRGAGSLAVAALLMLPAIGAGQSSERILVLPFENVSRDNRILWLSEAAAVLLADDLNALGAVAIEREERRIAFDRLQLPQAAALTDATVIRIGELVGASQIITGTLQLEGEELVVDARRIALDTARAHRVPAERGAVRDLFAVFDRLARAILPGPSRSDPTTNEHPPVAAFENYIKGLVAETPSVAIGYFNAALLADPTFARPRLALWEAYTNRGEHERALAAVRLVSPQSPLARRAMFLIGLSYLDMQRFDDAFEMFEELAELDLSASVLNNLGVVELQRPGSPQPKNAAYYFQRATELDQNHPDSFFNLGYASWLLGDVRSAVYWLRETVRRDPADGEAHYLLGLALAADGSATEANRERELALRLSSDYAEWEKLPAPRRVPDGLERVRYDVELPGARWVEDALAAAGQRDQREAAAFYLDRARRAFQENRDRDAAGDVSRSLFLDPYQAEAHLIAARIHLRGGRPSQAIDALKISLWSAETAEARATLADAYFEAGDVRSAREEAERALKLDPNSVAARRVLEQAVPEPTPR